MASTADPTPPPSGQHDHPPSPAHVSRAATPNSTRKASISSEQSNKDRPRDSPDQRPTSSASQIDPRVSSASGPDAALDNAVTSVEHANDSQSDTANDEGDDDVFIDKHTCAHDARAGAEDTPAACRAASTGSAHRPASTCPSVLPSDSDEYDTDLEEDVTEKLARPKDPAPSVGLVTYELACQDLGVPYQTIVADQLAKEVLNVAHRNLGHVAIKALSYALKFNSHVRELDLSANELGTIGMRWVSQMMTKNKSISSMNLSKNHISPQGSFYVVDMMTAHKALQRLDLSANGFDEESANLMSYALETNASLTVLDLSRNELRENGAEFIGAALSVNSTLKRLNLSWNHIRLRGAVALCNGLRGNVTLTHLDVSMNGFAHEGAVALSEMLKFNTTLLEVNAANNRINWRGAMLIADGLSRNQTLEVLRLGKNPLTTTGCLDLLDVVTEDGATLQELDLEAVPVTGEFDMMAAALRLHRNFRYKHGAIVPTPDVLGQREETRPEPFQRIIDFMRAKAIRPTELFGTFDSSISSQLTASSFTDKMEDESFDLSKWEMRELLVQMLEEGASSPRHVDYEELVSNVKRQVERQRYERVSEHEKGRRLEIYNKRPLRTDIPQIPDLNSPLAIALRATTPTDGSSSRRSSAQPMITSSMTSQHEDGTHSPSSQSKRTSMTSPAQGKSKNAAEADVKKKKNKKKKKKKVK